MMFWYGGHWAFWEAALSWLLMIGLWGLIIWAVYNLALGRRPPTHHGPGPDARQILDARLARGDIDTDTYRRLRDLIGSDRGDSRPPEQGASLSGAH